MKEDKIYLSEAQGEQLVLTQKKVLTFKEMCRHFQVSASWLYKKVSDRSIPHSKPGNKLLMFDREKAEAWFLSNPITPDAEVEKYAVDYMANNPARQWS